LNGVSPSGDWRQGKSGIRKSEIWKSGNLEIWNPEIWKLEIGRFLHLKAEIIKLKLDKKERPI